MNLSSLLRKTRPAQETLPSFIRTADDIEGIRVVRLQGSVGKEIGRDFQAFNVQAERQGGDVFGRPVLLDFKDTTDWDFSTVSFLVDALRRRMAASARVGIINAPDALVSELEIARLEGLFSVFDSEEEALAALAATDRPDEGNP
ncbi:MAG: STAS domain-containing protein [Planctomycetota bacterium]|jgi:anti-anti-sigma regulatory factor